MTTRRSCLCRDAGLLILIVAVFPSRLPRYNQGPIMAERAARTGRWRLEIVKRNDVPRFEVVPRRWIVERTLAWISHFRRLARDFERYARSVVAFVRLAMIRIMLRRLTRST